MPVYLLSALLAFDSHTPRIVPTRLFVPPRNVSQFARKLFNLLHILFPNPHGRNTMTKEIHQNEMVFNPQFPDITTHRIYLARRAGYQKLVFPIQFLKTGQRITLDIFGTDARNIGFHRIRHIMFRPVRITIITDTASLIPLTYQILSDFKTNSSG